MWVPGSRRYSDPTTLLLPAAKWNTWRGEYCALVGAPDTADQALEAVGEQLQAALGDLEPLLASGEGPVRMTEKGELVVNRLSAEALPDEVDKLRLELVELLPRPQLTELLIEVDRWASWSDQLTHAGGKTHRDPQLRRNLYAAILAQACNFGLSAMAEASGTSYDTLAWTTEWYLREDTLREANAAIVNHHHRLPLASVWGGGTMSSSDGQRFPMRGKSLTARAMSRYFVDEGVATYTHVSDQHSTYGTKVIPVTDREAVYVLDEILGNATDLPITEHATDTAGHMVTWTPQKMIFIGAGQKGQRQSQVRRCPCGCSTVRKAAPTRSSCSMMTASPSKSSRGSCASWRRGTSRRTRWSPTRTTCGTCGGSSPSGA